MGGGGAAGSTEPAGDAGTCMSGNLEAHIDDYLLEMEQQFLSSWDPGADAMVEDATSCEAIVGAAMAGDAAAGDGIASGGAGSEQPAETPESGAGTEIASGG